MQTEEAKKLKKSWEEKPCEHPSLEKEYYLGSHTGDYVCLNCGKTGWGRDWGKKEEK